MFTFRRYKPEGNINKFTYPSSSPSCPSFRFLSAIKRAFRASEASASDITVQERDSDRYGPQSLLSCWLSGMAHLVALSSGVQLALFYGADMPLPRRRRRLHSNGWLWRTILVI